jgi:hypothetical protein
MIVMIDNPNVLATMLSSPVCHGSRVCFPLLTDLEEHEFEVEHMKKMIQHNKTVQAVVAVLSASVEAGVYVPDTKMPGGTKSRRRSGISQIKLPKTSVILLQQQLGQDVPATSGSRVQSTLRVVWCR